MPNGSDGIFLSYRRDDADEAASLLQVCLERYLPGTPVFRDSSSIMPGADWMSEIDGRLRSSAVLLALIGPGWLTATDRAGNRRLDNPDDVLAGEIALALSLGMHVIPLLIKGAEMPLAEQLPWRLRGLAAKQSVELPHHRNIDLYLQGAQWLAARIGDAQAESARSRQAREQAPADRQVLDNKTPIPEFAAQIKRIRGGESPYRPSPAHAMATLRVFAQQRPIGELVGLWPAGEEASGFAPLDVVAILTLAAVDRSAAEVAELAVGLRQAEVDYTGPDHSGRGPAGLTERIIHDLAAQRTVPGVAEFIAECERRGRDDPAQRSAADFTVRETCLAFIGSASRVSLDKALLYFELLRFGCSAEADALLAKALSAEKPSPSGVVGEVGIVGALRHLSPAESIVENWLNEQVKAVPEREKTANLVANLLRNEPGGDPALAEHVGRTWPATPLIQLCEALANEEGSESPSLHLVRRYLATRDADVLADIMGQWYQSESATLRGTFPQLLSEIVTCPERLATVDSADKGDQERGLLFLKSLRTTLERRGTPPRCRSELLVAAATHIEHRSGAEAAELLGWIARPDWWRETQSDLWRAAQAVNAWFAEGLATRKIGTQPYVEHLNKLVDYLKVLQGRPDARKMIFWAVRELTDPTTLRRYRLGGEQLGGVAVLMYAGGLSDAAFDLLERYLENEQAVTPADVTQIIAEVRASAPVRDGSRMREDPLWEELLGGTIGRWTDSSRMKEVLDKLADGYPDEAEAIMSLSQ
jgi:hypothetical protein